MTALLRLLQGDCLDHLRNVADGTIDLVVADPPYWKVVNQKWDYKWRTLDEYVEWSALWLREALRVLRYGGSLYLFGFFRTVAHLVPILEQLGYDVRQRIVVAKGKQAISGRNTRKYKMFAVETEDILFAVKDPKPFVRSYLKEKQRRKGLTAKEINIALGVKSNGGGMWSIYTGNNVDAQIPTPEAWACLGRLLGFHLPYRRVAQTFNRELGFTDVWSDINFYGFKRLHPTQKPEELINRVVRVSSNPGDVVLDPFMGSGTTGVVCKRGGRGFVGIELDPEMLAAAESRIAGVE